MLQGNRMNTSVIFRCSVEPFLSRNRRPGAPQEYFLRGKSRDPVGASKTWIPASAGMTMLDYLSRLRFQRHLCNRLGQLGVVTPGDLAGEFQSGFRMRLNDAKLQGSASDLDTQNQSAPASAPLAAH
jgi:hypothetical protein